MRNLYSSFCIVLVVAAGPAVEAAAPGERQVPLPPKEMGQFAFLLGTWDCSGTWRQADGLERKFVVKWQGKLLLDGHAQIEEYRSIWPGGETFVYGLNYRMFDVTNSAWIVEWYDALHGASFDLGQPAIVKDDGGDEMIVFTPEENTNRNRAIYKNISEDAFTWQGDVWSDGNRTWEEAVMVIDCVRAPD